MEYVIVGLLAVILLLLLLLLLRRPERNGEGLQALNSLGRALSDNQRLAAENQANQLAGLENKTSVLLQGQTELVRELKQGLTGQIDRMDKELTEDQKQLNDAVNEKIGQLQQGLTEQMNQFRETMADQNMALQRGVNALLEQMRQTMSDSLQLMREENGKKLEEIRGTVDEKLQTTLEKRISESFQTVSQQLERVYKGLGEMQNLASDVGGLKKVLAGVKTRGILGEVQLGAILEEILAPEQYETNVATVPGSAERVEFAVRLPGEEERPVYLPIDSKFPGDCYAHLLDAREEGDREAVTKAERALETVLKNEARDIRDKYVSVPYTTNFGILFLPFEGLYAEVVNRGLMEELQREYRINVAGPSTMAALLNSLQMGFRTLAIQKRSSEVWEILGAVKTEFDKFGDVLLNMQRHLNQTSDDLEKLMTTRTKAISRRLKGIQQLEDSRAKELLSLTDGPADEE
ncbi:MAG: DNA recombination protein RmuC [Oscillospiraceae bacterium]|nr:DNA recombination protein RmuC [Oscillospiraceae bacterium]